MRHGQTDANANLIIQGGGLDLDLNTNGINQATAAANYLSKTKFDLAFASDLIRAVNTAKIVLQKQNIKAIETKTILRERAYGELEGKPVSDHITICRELGIHPTQYKPVGGESWLDVRVRAANFLSELALTIHTNQPKNILVVAHGGFNRALITQLLGHKIEQTYEVEQENCCINHLTSDSSSFVVTEINIIEHLKNVDLD